MRDIYLLVTAVILIAKCAPHGIEVYSATAAVRAEAEGTQVLISISTNKNLQTIHNGTSSIVWSNCVAVFVLSLKQTIKERLGNKQFRTALLYHVSHHGSRKRVGIHPGLDLVEVALQFQSGRQSGIAMVVHPWYDIFKLYACILL